jgi:phage baseplate assembly protein W
MSDESKVYQTIKYRELGLASDKIKYSDIDLDFIPHPVSQDIVPLSNAEAVKRALRNLLFTAKNERIFNPNFGANLRKLLFEPINPGTRQTLKLMIENTINMFEPRVDLQYVNVYINEDANGYDVTIGFTIDATSDATQFTMFLERLR